MLDSKYRSLCARFKLAILTCLNHNGDVNANDISRFDHIKLGSFFNPLSNMKFQEKRERNTNLKERERENGPFLKMLNVMQIRPSVFKVGKGETRE